MLDVALVVVVVIALCCSLWTLARHRKHKRLHNQKEHIVRVPNVRTNKSSCASGGKTPIDAPFHTPANVPGHHTPEDGCMASPNDARPSCDRVNLLPQAMPSEDDLWERELLDRKAMRNYEVFFKLPRGTATLAQVAETSAGIHGWAAWLDSDADTSSAAPPGGE